MFLWKNKINASQGFVIKNVCLKILSNCKKIEMLKILNLWIFGESIFWVKLNKPWISLKIISVSFQMCIWENILKIHLICITKESFSYLMQNNLIKIFHIFAGIFFLYIWCSFIIKSYNYNHLKCHNEQPKAR